ncbi:hypothetical protein RvY_09131-2 [Ramazzottius varieornatus]|nr:hypothetical protein RvY_09131-2 [Ramazzottius varieornatus]
MSSKKMFAHRFRTTNHILNIMPIWVLMISASSGQSRAQPTKLPERHLPPSLKEDPAHLKEHLKDTIDVVDSMSPEELEFHYFK